jgi:hypothetical protein
MADLAMPFFNMMILGSFLTLAVIEYRRVARLSAAAKGA